MILKHVKKVIQDYQDGKREGSIFSSFSADSLTPAERMQWRNIRKELEASGLTLTALDNNRDLITQYIVRAFGSGEHHDWENSLTKKGKGKEKVAQSAFLDDQSLISNPFADSAFEISSNRQDTVGGKHLEDIRHVSHARPEKTDLVSLDTGISLRTCFNRVKQSFRKSHGSREISSISREFRGHSGPFSNFLQGPDHDLRIAIENPREVDIAAEGGAVINRASVHKRQGTKILLLG